jgi:hypothetical protein
MVLAHRDQRAVHQHGEKVEDVVRMHAIAGADVLRRFQREAAAEDRQAPQQHTRVVGQQLVAPVNGGAQRAMPRDRRAAARQQPEDIVEPVPDVARRQYPRPRGRQFERQRDAVQPPADLDDGAGVLLGQCEAGRHVRRPFHEQAHGLGCGGIGQRARGSYGQRRDLPRALAPHAQRLPARRQDRQPGTVAQQRVRRSSGCVHQVLAVVENKKQCAALQQPRKRFQVARPDLLPQPRRLRDRRRDQAPVPQRRELDPHRLRTQGCAAGHQLQRQARLAAARRARQRQQPRALQERCQLR